MKGGRARSLSGIDRLRSVLSGSGEPVARGTPCERTVLTVESFGIPVPLPWADVSKRGDTRETQGDTTPEFSCTSSQSFPHDQQAGKVGSNSTGHP
jgi:hypothetical protein